MKRTMISVAWVMAASTVQAQDLRPAPEYYTNAIFSIQMAEALALSCSTVGVDLFATQARVTELDELLAADGFDTDQPFVQMIDPAPVLRDLQSDFLAKHPLQDPTEEKVCAAARTEIAEDTIIGKLLVEDPA